MNEDKLASARKEIEEIDREIAQLYLRRLEAVKPIAAYKKEHGLPVFDGKREDELIKRNLGFISSAGGAESESYVCFQKSVMELSKRYQSRLNGGMRVAYSGIEGAFACIAAGNIFPGAELMACADFSDAYGSVVSGKADSAVLPFENSSAGEVGQVWDLLFSGDLYVSGMYDETVEHDLLILPDAKQSDVREVVSHPQALSQCSEYIRAHGYRTREFVNTAKAAEFVAASGDRSLAAIASRPAAARYGLEIAAEGINENSNNTTRFAALSRVRTPHSPKCGSDGRFLLMFTVRNEAGALARAVDVIGRYGFNMHSLRSRPMKQLMWQYYFCAEAEGCIDSDNGRAMLEVLALSCDRLKLVGSYLR